LQVLLQLLNELLQALIGRLVADDKSEPTRTFDFALQFIRIFNLNQGPSPILVRRLRSNIVHFALNSAVMNWKPTDEGTIV
jgi:hypothetical protein